MMNNSCKEKTSSKNNVIQNKSLKGYELYSWQNGNDWFFSLVVGTNRNKSVKEVLTNKRQLKV